jgi:hypothetical protein
VIELPVVLVEVATGKVLRPFERAGNTIVGRFPVKWLKQRPQSGLGCLICTQFACQRTGVLVEVATGKVLRPTPATRNSKPEDELDTGNLSGFQLATRELKSYTLHDTPCTLNPQP